MTNANTNNPYENEHTINITVPSGGCTEGAGLLVGNIFGMALGTKAATETVKLALTGVRTLKKKSTDTPAKGAVVYWDNTNKELTTTASSNYKVGIAMELGVSGVTTLQCRLDGVSTKAES